MSPAEPVLYLDIDDTLVTYAAGHPEGAPGAREFVRWALGRFEVRWLTKWCPGGAMDRPRAGDLARMVGIDAGAILGIRGIDWRDSRTKLDGIAWLEHLVLKRPFVWMDDEGGAGAFELRCLDELGLLDRYRYCNTTTDPSALIQLHRRLREEFPAP